MQHLFISREYPPSPYSTGGIGTYVEHITRVLVEQGETVHVIAQQWPGAPRQRVVSDNGRLHVHRVALDEPPDIISADRARHRAVLQQFRGSSVPAQAFMWNAAMVAEWLMEHAGIDVIEAQEYEAPAYMLLARRAAGLGPARRVPVVVHLHTPTEFILRANGWEAALAEQAALVAAETFVIGAADALLCPSRFLARIAEEWYQLPSGRIHVLPYPLGDSVVCPRDARTWSAGTIAYIGRMEPRKGVSEWLDAAVSVATADPETRFVFIGGDTWWPGDGGRSVREQLLARVPAALRGRLTFADAIPRPELAAHLAAARIGVVPSRWENFPFTCIEAMASGLPVLVSPLGGMAEMVEDGRTGWIAEGADPGSLEAALRRALATPPARLADMGAAAAASIRERCGEDLIVRRSLAFRQAVTVRPTAPSRGDVLPLPLPDVAHAPAVQAGRTELAGDTMTLRQILRAPRPQQRAVLRRALGDPSYVFKWLAWHLRRGSSS